MTARTQALDLLRAVARKDADARIVISSRPIRAAWTG
jgi:hypothetical protein